MDLDFRDKRVTVVGLGIEGVDAVRFLARHGAYITVSDAKPREKLADRIEEVADLPVRLSLGANDPAEIADADAVFVSQGVPLDLPGILEAQRRELPVWSMLTLFMELCPGPVVGVTGSSGKTTTTALLGEMFRADGRPHFVGGNIGVGLLDHLEEIRAYTWVVLEISHTQLQLVRRSPHVAAVLNVSPNHLDRFSWDEYRQLKRNILRHQGPLDRAVLGYDDTEARSLAPAVKGETVFFTLSSAMPGEGVFVRDGRVIWKRGSLRQELFDLETLRLRGRHNQANALAAAAIACACGLVPEAMAEAVASFEGMPHRLEFVATVDGADYYNDSIATTPERSAPKVDFAPPRPPAASSLSPMSRSLPARTLSRNSSPVGEECMPILRSAFDWVSPSMPLSRMKLTTCRSRGSFSPRSSLQMNTIVSA